MQFQIALKSLLVIGIGNGQVQTIDQLKELLKMVTRYRLGQFKAVNKTLKNIGQNLRCYIFTSSYNSFLQGGEVGNIIFEYLIFEKTPQEKIIGIEVRAVGWPSEFSIEGDKAIFKFLLQVLELPRGDARAPRLA